MVASLATLLTGCTESEMEPHTIDSLGVVPAWSTDEAWRIADSADYVIGSAHGEHDAFMYVRAATQLSSGNVAILDMGVPGIRFYGVGGSHVRTIGQRGEGPGDFSVPASMAKGAGDTLIVADATQRRITVLDSAGRYIRSLGPASVERGDLMVLGMIGDGRVLIRVGDVRVWQDGLVRDTVVLGAMTLDSGDVTILARLPDVERVVELQDAAGNQTQREAPFGRAAHFAANGAFYYAGVSDRDEIRQYDAAGEPLAVIGGVRPVQGVPSNGASRYWKATLTGRRADRLKGYRDPSIAPTTMPAFDALRIDPSGNLWVRRYAPPWSKASSAWDVHDAGGQWLGTVTLPTGRTRLRDAPDLLEVGHDYVLVLQQDDADVQRVARYRLIKQDCSACDPGARPAPSASITTNLADVR
jgi:hypothetical protein